MDNGTLVVNGINYSGRQAGTLGSGNGTPVAAAEDISYNNQTSGLSSTDCQNAVDEIYDLINDTVLNGQS